jgi:mono/diheme cytochrome c family protein
VKRTILAAVLLVLGAGVLAAQVGKPAKTKAGPAFDESLPIFGTQISELPPGAGKATADGACVKCHSADVLRQQRLNEKQWAASVTKMTGWGADVPEAKRDELVAYLAKNFGPDNDRFQPVVTRPTGR